MTTATDGHAAGELRQVRIAELLLDPENPRLPKSYHNADQEKLAVVLEMGFEAYAVAQSIADNGFFLSEPLLVIADGSHPGKWVVVEGNRRLAALLGLTSPSIRAAFAEPERWDEVAKRSKVTNETTIPVIVHASRDSTHAEVGKAHVLGKLQWRPYAQATYIADRVAEGRTYAEVAELIGIKKSKVADLYRDQAIVAQAQRCGLSTSELEKAFSLLTVAMSSTKLRDHVGAPLGSRFEPGSDPIPDDRVGNLQELIGWVFGDEHHEPKISDSRQMSQLANVVANEVGLQSLRDGDTLEHAKAKVQAAGLDPKDRLMKRLAAAKNALSAATDDLADFASDAQVRSAVEDVEAQVEALRTTLDELASGVG